MHGWSVPPGPWGLPFKCQVNKECPAKGRLGDTDIAAAQVTMLARTERYFILNLKGSS